MSVDIIVNPSVTAVVLNLRARDVVGKVGHKRIFDASPEELDTLIKFTLAVKLLKQERNRTIESALEYTSAGHEVAGIGSEMVDDGVSLDHAGRVVDNITDEYELGG
jgi:hypothetical protein